MPGELSKELKALDYELAIDSLANALLRAVSHRAESMSMDRTLRENYHALSAISVGLGSAVEGIGFDHKQAIIMQIGSTLSLCALTEAAERQLFEQFTIQEPPEEDS